VALSLSNSGCIIGNMSTNVFAYADDLVMPHVGVQCKHC